MYSYICYSIMYVRITIEQVNELVAIGYAKKTNVIIGTRTYPQSFVKLCNIPQLSQLSQHIINISKHVLRIKQES